MLCKKNFSDFIDQSFHMSIKLESLQKQNETSSKPAPIQTRRSRVMHVEDKSKAFRQVVRKDQLAKLDELKKTPDQWWPQNFNGRRRIAHPVRQNQLKASKISELV